MAYTYPGRDYERLLRKSDPIPVEASKRVFLESEKPTDPTYALDFYLPGKAPSLTHEGPSAVPNTAPLIVLYRVRKNKIATVSVHTWCIGNP